MKKLICLLAMIVIPGIVFAGAEDDIKKHCETKWADNPSQQAHCEERQLSAKREVAAMVNSADDSIKGYADKCLKRWYPEYDKLGPCIDAYSKMAADMAKPAPEKKKGGLDAMKMFCEEKWGTDYKMREYCINKEIEGAKKIKAMLATALSGKDKDVMDQALRKCYDKWSPQYSMIHYCLKKQYGAYLRLK